MTFFVVCGVIKVQCQKRTGGGACVAGERGRRGSYPYYTFIREINPENRIEEYLQFNGFRLSFLGAMSVPQRKLLKIQMAQLADLQDYLR